MGFIDGHAGRIAGVGALDHPVGDRLGRAAHSGQRGAQLVGDGEQELPLPLLAVGQRLGETGQRIADRGDLRGTLGPEADVPVTGGQLPGRAGRHLQRPGDAPAEQQPGDRRAGEADGERDGEAPAQRRGQRIGGVRGLEQHDAAAVRDRSPLHVPPGTVFPDAGTDLPARGDLPGELGRQQGPVRPDRLAGVGHGHELEALAPEQRGEPGRLRPSRRAVEQRRVAVGLPRERALRLVRGRPPDQTDRDDRGEQHRQCRDGRGQQRELAGQRAATGPDSDSGPGHSHDSPASAAYPTPRTVRIGLCAPNFPRSWATCTSTVRVPAAAL